MSWYRPQEWISVPDRLFFRSHRDGAAAPVPGCLCGVGKGASPAPPRAPHAAPRFPCTAPRRPVLPCALPHPHASHTLCTSPAPPRASPAPPCAALASFPGPRTDAFPATSPPSSGKFAKAVRPVSHFLLLFLHFLPQFRRFGPRNPKKRQLFCVFMQFDQNIRKNKALFQGLTLHFFLYFPGFYVVLLVLISRHGEIKKKRV